jgi:hypothetical protein
MVALNSLDGQGRRPQCFQPADEQRAAKPASVVIINGAFAISIASLHSADKDPFIDHDPADKCACARAACAFVALEYLVDPNGA